MRSLMVYSSPNIVRVIKSRRMRWAGHVAHMGERRVYTEFWWGTLTERAQLGDQGVDGKIILRWIFRKWDEGAWTGSIWLRIGTVGGHLWMRYWTFRVPKNAGNFFTSCKPVSFTGRTLLHGVSKHTTIIFRFSNIKIQTLLCRLITSHTKSSNYESVPSTTLMFSLLADLKTCEQYNIPDSILKIGTNTGWLSGF